LIGLWHRNWVKAFLGPFLPINLGKVFLVVVDVRDTDGAGDAFDAAFICGILHGLSLDYAGRLANAAGGATVTKIGAGTRLPTKQEVMDLLKTKSIIIPFLEN